MEGEGKKEVRGGENDDADKNDDTDDENDGDADEKDDDGNAGSDDGQDEVDSIEDGYHDSCITIECQLFLLGRQIDQDVRTLGPVQPHLPSQVKEPTEFTQKVPTGHLCTSRYSHSSTSLHKGTGHEGGRKET